jgi:hypothetical protein
MKSSGSESLHQTSDTLSVGQSPAGSATPQGQPQQLHPVVHPTNPTPPSTLHQPPLHSGSSAPLKEQMSAAQSAQQDGGPAQMEYPTGAFPLESLLGLEPVDL